MKTKRTVLGFLPVNWRVTVGAMVGVAVGAAALWVTMDRADLAIAAGQRQHDAAMDRADAAIAAGQRQHDAAIAAGQRQHDAAMKRADAAIALQKEALAQAAADRKTTQALVAGLERQGRALEELLRRTPPPPAGPSE